MHLLAHLFMLFFLPFMHVLVAIFFVGILGSAVVVGVSFVEDLHELLGD
jgi:hypothetical protein